MKLNQIRIGVRLALSFAALILLMGIVGGVALFNLEQANERTRSIVTENNAKLEHSNDLSQAAHNMARVMRTLILLDDPAAKQDEIAKFEAARKAYEQAWAALASFAPSPQGARLRTAIEQARATATQVDDRIVEAARHERDAEAVELLMQHGLAAGRAWQDAIEANLDHIKATNLQFFEHSQATHARTVAVLIAIMLIAALLAVFAAWLITRSITGPIDKAVAAAASLAEGQLGVPIEPEGRDETALLLKGMADLRDSLTRIVSDVRRDAESVATASAQIAQGNHDLSGRTEQQAGALQQTASSMEELGSTVRQNADNAAQADQLAKGTATVATAGRAVVQDVITTMTGIEESSRRIAEIIGVIDGIAFQTNILALNAAVEAARAGEQGRGFAVVAAEVRALARRSADAAREIKQLIGASVERVGQGSGLVRRAGERMDEVVGSVRRVTDLMAEISQASLEQSNGVSQVGSAVAQMDTATQQNAALVEEMAAAAQSLQQQADRLVASVRSFQLPEPARSLP